MVREGTASVSRFKDNGLANSRFYTLLFGINRLRSDEVPHCRAKSHCSGAIVQLLCNRVALIVLPQAGSGGIESRWRLLAARQSVSGSHK